MAIHGEYDVLVVGTGMGGIYQTYTMKKPGLAVKAIDEADGTGGTRYWNHYPAAMSDTESYLHLYSWTKKTS